MRHETYNNVHEGVVNCATATCNNIRSHHNVLHTVTTKKVALVKVERKRYWLNAVDSVAFDHPSIKATTKTTTTNDKNILQKQRFKRKHEDDREYPLMLTYKRIRSVQDFW